MNRKTYKIVMAGIAAENGGIITTKNAERHGFSRTILYNLNKKGVIQRIAHGQYVVVGEHPDHLLSIGMRSSRLIFSHETALWLHGLSDRTPDLYSVTAPSGRVPSNALRGECKYYYMDPRRFELGKTTVTTPYGNTVTAYDLERTICDCVRSRNRLDKEMVLNALKQYAARKDRNPEKLRSYAEKLCSAKAIREYLAKLF